MNKKDMKILITALVILVVGALFFNYTNITGKVTSDYITVSPQLIKAGESINIAITPGRQGVYSEIEFYRADENDIRVGGVNPNICGGVARCYEKVIVDYKILDIWDNNAEWDYTVSSKTYYARVYDIYSGTYKIAYFTVERAYEAVGPAGNL